MGRTPHLEFQTITVRLYKHDVAALQRRAAKLRVPWHLLLRETVRRAMAKKESVVL